MPLFDYACDDCGHAFEALVRGSETPACPECGRQHLTKQLSRFATTSGAPDVGACDMGEGPCGAQGCCQLS